jgi:hypothetical protein
MFWLEINQNYQKAAKICYPTSKSTNLPFKNANSSNFSSMMVAFMNFFQVCSKEKFKFGSKLGKIRVQKAKILFKNLHIPAMLRIFFVVVDLSSAKKS